MKRALAWALPMALVMGAATAPGSGDPPHRDRPSTDRTATKRTGIGTMRVPAPSMEPTVPVGSLVQVDFDAFASALPGVGEIVIFRPPRSAVWGGRLCAVRVGRRRMCPRPVRRLAPEKFVKRVVALPGDRLRMHGGRLVRNGELVDEPFADVSRCRDDGCDYPREVTVAAGHYFVLGDNRGASDDSRFWGPIPPRALIGRVVGCMSESGDPCGD
jgi:signal peptidase I